MRWLRRTWPLALAVWHAASHRPPVQLVPRFRYNPTMASLPAIGPSIPPLLLLLFPAILMAVSVAREKEIGTITNFYVTPTGRAEFLIGKQLVYIGITLLNFAILTALVVLVLGVPMRGEPAAACCWRHWYTPWPRPVSGCWCR